MIHRSHLRFFWTKYMQGCIAFLIALLSANGAAAQGKLVDSRDQAEGWFLPIHGKVYVEGKPADQFELTLFKDNVELGKVKPKKKGQFELELDIDQMYTLYFTRPGTQPKMIYVDTTLPKDLVTYPDYLCYVNLSPMTVQPTDPFYTDFPSAIVQWNDEMKGFYHSEHYLTHIQTRLSGIANATF